MALVARFVEPDPIVYTRLAMVSWDFYTAFTSDQLWAPLDVYELENDIFNNFIDCSKGDESLLREMWIRDGKRDPVIQKARITDAIKNRYAYMGYLMNARNRGHKGDDVELMKLIASIKPSIIKGVPENIAKDPDVILNAFRHGKEALRYAHNSLKKSRDFCHRVIDVMSRYWIPERWKYDGTHSMETLLWFDKSILDREMAEYALEVYPCSIVCLYGTYTCNPEVRDLLDELFKDREKLLALIPGHYPLLEKLQPECWKDKELCLRALSGPSYRNDNSYREMSIRCNDPEVVKVFVTKYPNFSYVPGECMRDKDVVLYALKNISLDAKMVVYTGGSIEFPYHIDPSLWGDPEVIALVLDKAYEMQHNGEYEKIKHLQSMLDTLEMLELREEYRRGIKDRDEAIARLQRERQRLIDSGELVLEKDSEEDAEDEPHEINDKLKHHAEDKSSDGPQEKPKVDEEVCDSDEDMDNTFDDSVELLHHCTGRMEGGHDLVYAGGPAPTLKIVDGVICIEKSEVLEEMERVEEVFVIKSIDEIRELEMAERGHKEMAPVEEDKDIEMEPIEENLVVDVAVEDLEKTQPIQECREVVEETEPREMTQEELEEKKRLDERREYLEELELLDRYQEGDYLALALADPKVLQSLCDDRDWIKARIENRGDSWNIASRRLKQDRELFLLAIKGETAIKNSPKGLVQHAEFNKKLGRCPKVFHNDEEVLRALATLRPLREVPRTDLVKKIIKETARVNHGMLCYGTDSECDLYSDDLRGEYYGRHYSEPELDSDDYDAIPYHTGGYGYW